MAYHNDASDVLKITTGGDIVDDINVYFNTSVKHLHWALVRRRRATAKPPVEAKLSFVFCDCWKATLLFHNVRVVSSPVWGLIVLKAALLMEGWSGVENKSGVGEREMVRERDREREREREREVERERGRERERERGRRKARPVGRRAKDMNYTY